MQCMFGLPSENDSKIGIEDDTEDKSRASGLDSPPSILFDI